ncbi:MAG: sigma-54-dependent Fis family transcriptional regulator [Neptuniibacter sp.]
MSDSPQVLIIDDDLTRRDVLEASLVFLDQKCRFFSFVDWLQSVQDKENVPSIKLILLGQSQLPLSLEKIIGDLADQYPTSAIITIGEWNEAASLPAEIGARLVGQLQLPLNYQQFLDCFHKAQIYRGSLTSKSSASDSAELFASLVGNSESMIQVRSSMQKVAGRDVNVMITGESGTGKEVVARNLHDHSVRKNGPFVPINCGAIPADLLESELFGHEKGAFTGAVSSRPGRFELAQGGTLFLDEIGDMPLPMQVKLLRVLQERKYERIGGSKTLEADVRVIAATHKNLEEMIVSGEFREDLYYRLNVFPIEMPPLRQRIEDLPLLLEELLGRLKEQGLDSVKLHSSAIASLQKHSWPGNVRELSNLLERLAIVYPDGVVGVSELPAKFQYIDEPDPERYKVTEKSQADNVDVLSSAPSLDLLPEGGVDLKEHLELIEKSLIEQALSRNSGVVARAAETLQIRRTTLVEKMRKFGIQRK